MAERQAGVESLGRFVAKVGRQAGIKNPVPVGSMFGNNVSKCSECQRKLKARWGNTSQWTLPAKIQHKVNWGLSQEI